MVVEETQQGARGEEQHFVRLGGPHGAAHGHEIKIEKVRAVIAGPHVVGEGERIDGRILKCGDGLAIEAVDLEQHPVERRTKEIPALGKKMVEGRAAEFQAGVFVAHTEGHVGLFHRNVKRTEKPGQLRVGLVVENHEAGVDRHRAAGARLGSRDGVGVTPGIAVLLEERDVEVPVEKVGATKTGNSCANDGESGHDK